VRWSPELSETSIAAEESAHGLRRLDAIGPLSWQYEISRWSVDDLRALVTDAAVADTDGIDRQQYRLTNPRVVERVDVTYHPEIVFNTANSVAALYYLAWIAPLIALPVALTGAGVPRPVVAVAALAIVVQLLMDRSMLRDPLTTRVRDVMAPLVVLLAFLCGRVSPFRSSAGRRIWRTALATACLALALTAAAIAGDLPQRLDDGVSGEPRAPYTTSRTRGGPINPGYRHLVEYLSACSPERSRFLGLTFAPEVFFYTGHGFAGGHESLVPGFYTSDRDTSLILDRLSREDVPFTMMDSETSARMRTLYPRLMAYVDDRYREVASFQIAQGKFLYVLADARRQPVRSFGDARLPCFASASSV
jgi:hypothetical protein